MATYKDAAGNERTEEQIRELVRDSLREMSQAELLDIVMESHLYLLHDHLTKCEEHGLWYDECEDYL